MTSSIFEWMAPVTTIEVTNASDKVIRSLDITYSGMGDHKGRIAENLKPGEKITFKWATDGEASYRLHATFEDGVELRGGAGYTERGDTVKETIEAQLITSLLPMGFKFGFQHSVPRDTTSRK